MLTRILPQLYALTFPEVAAVNVYIWLDGREVTLIDSGVPGSAPAIAAVLVELGRRPADVVRLIVTHGHVDHYGSAPDVAGWGAEILAHVEDAPVLRGDVPKPEPTLRDWERPIYEAIPSRPAPTVTVDRELRDGDVLDFGGGARIVAIPGHTHGSIAVHLPAHRVLFVGDTVANVGGYTVPGTFNVDCDAVGRHAAAIRDHDVDVVCVGHGEPLFGAALTRWRDAGS
ncbi:MBL fold metallo-hydrolase [Tsukamurella soli]|uniref:MBL fold metallo-hydrolase n=1 Tax=Tsukamurella soli TaxID=644556 RepID=A0ABP8JLP0_9ACTN